MGYEGIWALEAYHLGPRIAGARYSHTPYRSQDYTEYAHWAVLTHIGLAGALRILFRVHIAALTNQWRIKRKMGSGAMTGYLRIPASDEIPKSGHC